MQLRVVALVELDTSVSHAAKIQEELETLVDTFRSDDGVVSVSVDTLARRGDVCKDVNQIVFRRKKYDAKTGRPINA